MREVRRGRGGEGGGGNMVEEREHGCRLVRSVRVESKGEESE